MVLFLISSQGCSRFCRSGWIYSVVRNKWYDRFHSCTFFPLLSETFWDGRPFQEDTTQANWTRLQIRWTLAESPGSIYFPHTSNLFLWSLSLAAHHSLYTMPFVPQLLHKTIKERERESRWSSLHWLPLNSHLLYICSMGFSLNKKSVFVSRRSWWVSFFTTVIYEGLLS